MRKSMILICFSLFAFTLFASPINGIRINGDGSDIIVFIDGKQVCTPTGSCFIANLPGGAYLIEVYRSQHSSHGLADRKGKLLYRNRIHYRPDTMKEIIIETGDGHIGSGDGYIGSDNGYIGSGDGYIGSGDGYFGSDDTCHSDYPTIMEPESFAHFLKSLKDQRFDDNRNKLMQVAVITTYFTTAQCLEIQKQYDFSGDKMVKLLKMIYPRIVDKQNFFQTIGKLTFSSDIDQVNQFVIKYHQQ